MRAIPVVAGAVIGVSVLVYGTPWALYAYFAHRGAGTPEKTAPSGASTWQLKNAWGAHQGFGPYPIVEKGPIVLDSLTPWTPVATRVCAHNWTDSGVLHDCIYKHRGSMPAYYVAEHFLEAHAEYAPSTLSGTLRAEALQVWVTRNWSAEEVAEYLLRHKPDEKVN